MSTTLPLKRKPARARTLLRRLFPRDGVRAQLTPAPADSFIGSALSSTSGGAWAVLEDGVFCAAAIACGLWLEPSDP